jgi:hypothetical protein
MVTTANMTAPAGSSPSVNARPTADASGPSVESASAKRRKEKRIESEEKNRSSLRVKSSAESNALDAMRSNRLSPPSIASSIDTSFPTASQ